jgi:hypothetical protein
MFFCGAIGSKDRAAMKRGKEFRDPRGHPTTRDAPKEIPVLMFVMVEKATGAFTLRCVSNDTVIDDLRKQGALDTFLADADELLPGISPAL